jgi:hypothetical protein
LLHSARVCQAQYDQLTQVHGSLAAEHKILTTQQAEIKSQYGLLKILHDKIQQDYEGLKNKANCS